MTVNGHLHYELWYPDLNINTTQNSEVNDL